MPNSNKFKVAAFAAVAAMGTFAISTGTPAMANHHAAKAEKAQPNIVEAAMSTGVHDTLVTAVKAADLVDTLSGPGPFTVFAPTDDAFAALPDGTVAGLLEPEAKDQLTTVLTYHVVSGRVPSAALSQAIRRSGGSYSFDTIAGESLTASFDSHGAIVITDGSGRTSKVAQADVKTTNGVIHVTDGVFLPG
ncbi:fasciclin domain-containing protein [Altererythrobacter arenosus]|uniref:Fasciclin domain-containing protein n=1 Tax=Altererythrobacter arenosus TaxID=3032592 RepID=A0ABY8FSX1_9SPHN|nr:fasciclin domain-containing protein [Altererythrobacter sp. CAU 1644]WFL78117.1 fasciclin domain-containing protein [Altererythrobacter sp. CAU 1644]